MAATLDVWIMRPGHVSRVDDHEWIVRVCDSEGSIFTWGTTDYDHLIGAKAHWVGAIPPGTYVVQAALKGGSTVVTDHAIAVVGCDGNVCVRLFVNPHDKRYPPPNGGGRDDKPPKGE
jgi:hypothetical protein